MLREWTVKNGHIGADFLISGETLIEAIEANFKRMARSYKIGNAAGFRLLKVVSSYVPGLLGGRGGVEVKVEWEGEEMVPRSRPRGSGVKSFLIYANQDDLPEPYEHEIKND